MKKLNVVKIGIFLLINILNFKFSYAAAQTITVSLSPDGVTSFYKIGTGTGGRQIIDLGHFENGINGEIDIGTVEITIEMGKNGETVDGSEDIQLVMNGIDNTKTWSYSDIVSFIGGGNPNGTLKVKGGQINVIEVRGNTTDTNGTFKFSNPNSTGPIDVWYLRYSFKLTIELENLEEGAMYGFSAEKQDTTGKAYINLKDSVLDQLRSVRR